MKRKEFLKAAGVSALSFSMISALNKLEKTTESFSNSEKMPVLFLGHGSPMNGIQDNEFVRGFVEQGRQLGKPNAIVVVSAHWETKGTYVTAMEQPKTIHDFGGFPKSYMKFNILHRDILSWQKKLRRWSSLRKR